MTVYAVARGKQTGLYYTWNECKAQVHGVSKPLFRKFDDVTQARAFLEAHNVTYDTTATNTRQASVSDVPLTAFFNVTTTKAQTSIPHTQSPEPPPKPHTIPSTSTSAPLATSPQTPPSLTVHYVYTDGACVHNGRPSARAGAGVYFGPDDARNQSVRVVGKQSNNTGEVTAVLLACEQIRKELVAVPEQRFVICTDSKYTIGYANQWGQKQARAQWADDIPNKALVKQLYETLSEEPRITLHYVKAHTGQTDVHSVGNAQADRLATEAVVEHGKAPSHPPNHQDHERKYLNVSYARKNQAKALGAKWDKHKKKWYYVVKTNQDSRRLDELFGCGNG